MAVARVAPLAGLRAPRRQRHPIPARQTFHHLREIEVFELHQELEDVTALMAAETVVQAFFGIDRERRSLLLVEGTQPLPGAALFFQPHVLARHVDQVGGLADTGDDITVQVSVDHRGIILAQRGNEAVRHSGSEAVRKIREGPWPHCSNARLRSNRPLPHRLMASLPAAEGGGHRLIPPGRSPPPWHPCRRGAAAGGERTARRGVSGTRRRPGDGGSRCRDRAPP